MNYEDLEADTTTKTMNRNDLEKKTSNIFKSIDIIGKRAIEINEDIKNELASKLMEVESYEDSLEEVFENKEQIAISKYYETLPKPTALATKEWLNGDISYTDVQ